MIRKAGKNDLSALTALACKLWPDNGLPEMEAEMAEVLARADAALFLSLDGKAPVGFAQCQLRYDYVEGTASSPIGYLEGIYVAEGHRKRGIAKELLSACERWAKEKGCKEFASDCELANAQSLRFHLKAGFTEANRIICFTKQLL